MGTLKIEGMVRGARLAADRLVHLQGFGDFMVERASAHQITALGHEQANEGIILDHFSTVDSNNKIERRHDDGRWFIRSSPARRRRR